MIYKIFRPEEWAELDQKGETIGAPIDVADGYIHFSSAGQVAETAAKHFAGEKELVLVSVDETRMGPALKWETSRGGALFPHLYRKLTTEDVARVDPIGFADGKHILPGDLT